MNRPPLHPRIKRYRREFRVNALAATALWAVAALIAVLPFALWATGALHGYGAGVAIGIGIGIAIALAVATGAPVYSSKAWSGYSDYREELDQREWDEYQAEQKRMEKIMREEGLA